MKPILFLAGALLAGAASAGLTVLLVSSDRPVERAAAAAAPSAVSPAAPADLEGLRGELEMLSHTVAELQSELASLRAQQSRQPLAAEDDAAVTPESLAAAGLTPVQIEERMRDVFAAERQREQDERDAEMAERARQMATRQAERIAGELNLSAADTTRLADHLFTAGEKRREIFEGMRDGGFDRDAMRASMEEMREWNSQELYRTFSPAVAAQLEEMGNDVFGGGRGGPGGPGGFGGGRRGGFGGNGDGGNAPGGG